jgi:hypothetical protein
MFSSKINENAVYFIVILLKKQCQNKYVIKREIVYSLIYYNSSINIHVDTGELHVSKGHFASSFLSTDRVTDFVKKKITE